MSCMPARCRRFTPSCSPRLMRGCRGGIGCFLTAAWFHLTLIPSLSIDKGDKLKSVKLLIPPLAALLAVTAAACGGSSSAATASGGGKVNLVAYSTPQPAYEKLIPAFQGTAAG